VRAATPLGQTFSAGLAVWDGVESSEEMIARADAALYAAKAAGRSRTEVAAAAVTVRPDRQAARRGLSWTRQPPTPPQGVVTQKRTARPQAGGNPRRGRWPPSKGQPIRR
jgi:hypothetical protein